MTGRGVARLRVQTPAAVCMLAARDKKTEVSSFFRIVVSPPTRYSRRLFSFVPFSACSYTGRSAIHVAVDSFCARMLRTHGESVDVWGFVASTRDDAFAFREAERLLSVKVARSETEAT